MNLSFQNLPKSFLFWMSISWDEAKSIISDGSVEKLARLERNAEVLASYRLFRTQLMNEWLTVTDYLIATVFADHARVSCQDDGKKRAEMLVEREAPVKVWRMNDFPYDFEAGVQHYCLWSSQPLSYEEIISEIHSKFDQEDYDHLYFVNPPSLQSIRDLWHCHVMIKFQHR